MFELEFTGERVVPGKVDRELFLEHISRYEFAGRFVRDLEVLDFGCGTGYGSAALRRAGARSVVGSDLSAPAILFAKAHYERPGVSFCVADCEGSGFATGSFDAIVSFELMEHLRSYPRFLAESRRLLRPGGLFLVSTPNTRVYRREPGATPNPFHVHEFTPEELTEVLGESFRQVRIVGQSRTEGAFFRRIDGAGSGVHRGPGGAGPRLALPRAAGDSATGGSPYLLALCTDAETEIDLDDYFHVSEIEAVSRRDHRILELQSELEERTRWARQIEDESSRRGQRVLELQGELEERTRWAQELEKESEARSRRVLELQAELEERMRWATRMDKERQERGQRIQQLQGELDLLGRSIQRLSGLEDRFEKRLVQIEDSLGRQTDEAADRDSRQEGWEQSLRWQRDSLIRQQREIEAQRDELAELERRQAALPQDGARQQAALRRSLERQQHTLDGLERQVSSVSQQMERHQIEHTFWEERSGELELAATRSRHLVDLLWDSRSWSVYTGLKRLFTALTPARLIARREQRELPRVLAVDPAPAAAAAPSRRALIIDHRLPTPDQDAGSVRTIELIDALQRLGVEVTFMPENLFASQPYCRRLEARGVEVIVSPAYTSARSYLAEHGPAHDLVFVSRFHIATGCIDMARELCPNSRLVFDTVDLQFLRLHRRAEVEGDRELLAEAERTRREELGVAARADATLVVSEVERELLRRELPGHEVRLVSLIHEPRGEVPGFAGRDGFFFVGGFEHPPNVDAVHWLASEVLPLVREELPDATFHVLGSKAPDSIYALEDDHLKVHGHVRDLEPYLAGCRLAVAPLRYGAGIKGKVTQSLAEGLPCVMTSVAAEGIGLTHGVDAMIADDPESFAGAMVEVYRDAGLWTRLSEAGRERIRQQFSRRVATDALRELLDGLAPAAGVAAGRAAD